MNRSLPQKRPYDSSHRKEQARHTRLQIIEAGRKLFIARGYSGATMNSIAREAGVAVDTVYASFKSKRAILSSLVGISLVGDDDPTPLLQRPQPLAVMQERDQVRQIQLFVEDMAEIMERVAPLFEVMHYAAKSEPDIDKMLQRMLNERAEAMNVFITALASNLPLKPGLTQPVAAETTWALTSAEVYNLLVIVRGWSVSKYSGWLADALIKLLLP